MPAKLAVLPGAPTESAKVVAARIPMLRDVSPKVVELEKRIAALFAQRVQLDVQRNALFTEAMAPNALVARQKARDDALLATVLGETTTGPGDLSTDLSAVTEKIRVIDAAIVLLRGELDIANRDASALICQQLRGAHEHFARAMLAPLLALHSACKEYQTFTNALENRNLDWGHFKPAFPRFLGDPGDPYSPVAIYLRSQWEADRIDEIPNGLREGDQGNRY